MTRSSIYVVDRYYGHFLHFTYYNFNEIYAVSTWINKDQKISLYNYITVIMKY